MKKTLTVTISSALAFIAFNHVASANTATTSTIYKAPQQNVAKAKVATTYIVKPGDSLYKIALQHNLTLNQLYTYNPGVKPLIFPGDVIFLTANQQNQTSAYQSTAQSAPVKQVPVASQTQVQQPTQPRTVVNEPKTPIVQHTASPQRTVQKTTQSTTVSYQPQTRKVQQQSTAHKSIANSGNLYAYGNCTYYAFDRRAQLGRSIGSLWGNANNWGNAAAKSGFVVNNKPEVGAIFQTANGPYGHVGVVESVNANGTVTVSEMNYKGYNVKSTRTITNPGAYNYIH